MMRPHRRKLLKNEVMELFKTSKETLRYYEKKGLLSPQVDDNGYRLYDVEDMKRLRQLFMLKDLGISIYDMQRIVNGQMGTETYKQLLIEHEKTLKMEILRLEETQKNVAQVLSLIDREERSVAFLIKDYDRRHYITFNPFDYNEITLKDYYDTFEQIIALPYYQERMLQSFYNYQSLDKFNQSETRMCIEVYSEMPPEIFRNFDLITLEKGRYLSVFYAFREGQFEKLAQVKIEIENYLEGQNLHILDERVIESEHQELSLNFKPHEMLYEIQVRVGEV